MPGLQVLEVEPDKLFEKYTVSEIESLQKSINDEIERKREELRTLVGERYRDLIEAADTIADMKILSEQVIGDVECMNTALAQLQKKHCVRQPTTVSKPSRAVGSNCTVEDEIAAQIKLLVDLPEFAWNCIESGDYVTAAQLFLLARHVKTGFSVDKALKDVSSNLTVLEQLWSMISHFPATILKAVEADLLKTDLCPKETCSCLVGTALLENSSLVSKYLSVRSRALTETLTKTDDVRSGILSSHSVVVNTMYSLQHCFIDSWDQDGGRVWKTIQNISSKSGNSSIIDYLEPNIIFSYLPPVILQYRITPVNKGPPMTLSELKSAVANWLDFVRCEVNTLGKTLLNNITSLRALHSLTGLNFKMDPEWFAILKRLDVPEKLDLWNDLYKPLISARAKELITFHWQEAFSEVMKDLNRILNDDSTIESESDLRWFIWKEAQSDLNEIKGSAQNIPKGLWLKAKGISLKVSGVCSNLQGRLESVYKDVDSLLTSSAISEGGAVLADASDRKLSNHQQSECLAMVIKLKEFVRELINRESVNETELAIVARFLQAIPDLCPALQKCLTFAEETKGSAWQEAKTLLYAESLSCWSSWEERTMAKLIASIIPQLMKQPTTLADLLAYIPQWDVVVIEEGEEGNQIHRSEVKIPSSPSLPLQQVLAHVSRELSCTYPPKLVNENLMQKLVTHLVTLYTSEPLCQAHALQNLMDVKFMLTQFIPTTNKELCNKFHETVAFIESKIDPFDLDVFSPHIHISVKANVQRLQTIYGTVNYFMEGSGSGVKMSEDPCLLPLSRTSSDVWFPPLPVTNPANRPVQIMKSKASKTTGKQNSGSNSDPATEVMAKVGASSFFTDWFS